MMDQIGSFRDLSQLVIADDGNGQELLRLGVRLKLSIDHASYDGAPPYQQALALFRDVAPVPLHPFSSNDFWPTHPFAGDPTAPQAAIGDGPGLYELKDAAEPPHWRACLRLSPRETRADAFYLTFPADMLEADGDRLVDLVLQWAQMMRPLHGVAGFALNPRSQIGPHWHDIVWPYVARFAGLDANVQIPGGLTDQISAVNWLTLIGDRALARLGGIDTLKARLHDGWAAATDTGTDTGIAGQSDDGLPPGFSLHFWDGGVMVRAGKLPQVGDVNMGLIPREYCAINQALRPIRYEGYTDDNAALLHVPKPLNRLQETLNWVRRFDIED